MNGDDFQEAEKSSSGSKWLIILIVAVVLVILLVGAYFLFQSLSKSDSSTSSKNQESESNQDTGSQLQGKIIECGDIPKDFDAQNETYLDNNPEVKKDLLCISEAFGDCKDSSITFLGEQVDNILSIKKENNKCIIDYKSGTKGIKCEYTPSQTKMLHEVSIDNNHPELTGLGIAFGMGMELTFGFKPGETKEQEITNKDTGQKEKIPCTFYGSADETTKENNQQNTEDNSDDTTDTTGTIDYNGKQYQQGVAYYNEANPDDCFYDIYVLESYIQETGSHALTYCKQECERTGGARDKYISLNKLDSEGHGYIFAYKCVCNKC